MAFKLGTFWTLASIAPPAFGVNQHDYSPTGLAGASLIWLTPSGTIDFTGLAGGEERRLMFLGLRNSAAFSVNILGNSGSSAAANRFADGVVMNASGTGKIITAWIYLGGKWRRWKF